MPKLFGIFVIFVVICKIHGWGNFYLDPKIFTNFKPPNPHVQSVESVEKNQEVVETTTIEHSTADSESDEDSNELNPYENLWDSIRGAIPDDVEDAIGNAFNKVHEYIKEVVPDDVEDAVVDAGKAIGKFVQDVVPDDVEKAVGNAAGKVANELQKIKPPKNSDDAKEESQNKSESVENSKESEEEAKIEPKKLNMKKLNKKKIHTKARNLQKKKMIHTKELKKSDKLILS